MILVTSTIVSLALHFFVKITFEHAFKEYVKAQEMEQLELMTDQLAAFYRETEGWQRLVDNHSLWMELHKKSTASLPRFKDHYERKNGPDAKGKKYSSGGPPGPPPEKVGPRIVLYDADKKWIIGGPKNMVEPEQFLPLYLDDSLIGYLAVVPAKRLLMERDRHFFQKQARFFAWIPLIIVMLSLLLSLPMTNHLLRPIIAMTEGTRKLIAGQFGTRIPVTTGDELGRLSKDFNILAKTLDKNETNRKQWVADISHELRTPLAVLRGEIEALQDGIRNPDEQTIEGIHAEVMHLERMVGDLYELSTSDIGALNYKQIVVDPAGILEGVVESFEQRMAQKEIVAALDVAVEKECAILADPDRLQQLFSNILENSLRYTDGPGRVAVHLTTDREWVTITFQDSAPGVPEVNLDKLFDRFYRVESSRNRATGGAGLGLAICKNIVDAHAGTIKAGKSSLGGVLIKIELPLA